MHINRKNPNPTSIEDKDTSTKPVLVTHTKLVCPSHYMSFPQLHSLTDFSFASLSYHTHK